MSVANKLAQLERAMRERGVEACPNCRGRILSLQPETGYLPDAPVPGYPAFAGNETFDATGHCRRCGARPFLLLKIVPMGGGMVLGHAGPAGEGR